STNPRVNSWPAKAPSTSSGRAVRVLLSVSLGLVVVAFAPAVDQAPAAAEQEAVMTAPGSLDQWFWRYPRIQGNDLSSAAYGNGRFVLVGREGAVLTPTD